MVKEKQNPESSTSLDRSLIENNEIIRKMMQKKTSRSLLLVIVGTIIYSFGVVWILQVGGFFSGGVTGTSQLIVAIVGKFGNVSWIEGWLGVFVGLINVPLVIWGWRGVSRHFAILTVVSIGLQTIVITLLSNFTISPFVNLLNGNGEGIIDAIKNGSLTIGHTEANVQTLNYFKENMEPGTRLLLALIGGGITGFGAALCLKGGGSTGGMDIVANYLMMKKKIPFTKYQMTVDVSIILLSSLISVENVLYTLVRLFVYMRAIDLIYSTYKITRLEVITNEGEKIREALVKKFHHGLTIFQAKGGYTLQERNVLEIYVSVYEVHDYLKIIYGLDSHAFVVQTKVKTIAGNYIQKTIV